MQGFAQAFAQAVAHAFAHILYKGLLFMSMGAVLYRVGTCKASELGGIISKEDAIWVKGIYET